MTQVKLFMILLGCKPKGRNTEQHDVFFGIGNKLSDLKNELISFWPEAAGKIHIDAWREVSCINDYRIEVNPRTEGSSTGKLFFINLGGYKRDEFEEFHYKLLTVANDKGSAIRQAKETAFYKHTGFEGATSHVDDKYGIDVDDIYEIEDILASEMKERYRIVVSKHESPKADALHLGYLKLEKLI